MAGAWVTARAGMATAVARGRLAAPGCLLLLLTFTATAAGQAPPGATGVPAPAGGPTSASSSPAGEAATAGLAPAPEVPSRPLDDAFTLDAGATCLDRERLLRRVARWLQTDRVEATLQVEVRGDPHDARKVSFTIDRGQGDRGVRSIDDGPADCDQLHAALALSIALAIDANLGLGGTSQSDLPDDDELLASKPKPAYFKLGAALLLNATSGLLTDVSAGASARIEAGFLPWLDFRLGAFGSTVTDQRIPHVSPGTFDASLIAGRADVCLGHSLGKLRLLACAGGMAGVFRADGHGFARSAVDDRPYGAAIGGFELQAELARWLAVGAAVDLVVPFATRRIQVQDALMHPGALRTLTSVAVLVGAGPVLRFF